MLTAVRLGTLTAGAAEHPGLLLTSGDVVRLRHVCGIEPASALEPGWGRFGAGGAAYQGLRAQLERGAGDELLPGELLAAAFLHTVDPNDSADGARLRTVAAALERGWGGGIDALELVVALDWCWPALPASVRRDFVVGVRDRALPLTPADSPLEPRRFRERLAALALAVALDEADEPSASWTELRTRLLDGGRAYFTSTFPTWVAWRTLSPTGPAAAPREESDTVLALEVAGRLLGRDLWPEYQATVGRWLEHYVLGTLEHPAVQHNFIRDDGTDAPLTPASAWHELLPLTAHLVAVRTQNSAAALLAERVEEALARASDDAPARRWRWVPLVFDVSGIARCDAARLPTGRNLGGAVVLRGGTGVDTTAVWIDAGQPFLRRRQHFDAGHFLVCRGGHLVGDGGEDVASEAVASKGGSQQLGREKESFDFEQYFAATIAHNCVVVWDPVRVLRWYGTRFWPVGGQRCQENTCTDFVTSLDAQGRVTGRQLAYGQREDAAYLALDLASAYDDRTLTGYTREFVFLWGRALVVVDRVVPPRGRNVPTWVLNLPARPSVDGGDLTDATRVAGQTNEGGVWRCDDATGLRWTDRDGAAWFTAPWPAPRVLRVVGGPARKLVVAGGRHAERTYVGGDADGFEHLIVPAERPGARNAWYRLGQPTVLGPEFGQTPHWGRLELEPRAALASCTFVAVLITDRADATEPPRVTAAEQDGALRLELESGPERASLRLPAEAAGSGTLEVVGRSTFTWTLPAKVEADLPLATRNESSAAEH